MNDKILINLHMAGNSFRVSIYREDEQMVREAAKQVNMRFNQNQAGYPSASPERLLATVAFEFALETLRIKDRNDTEPYAEKIKELSESLEDYFKEP